MNEKEAREIVLADKNNDDEFGLKRSELAEGLEMKYETPWHMLINNANGYLEGIEGAKGLVGALEKILTLKQHVYNGEQVWSTTPLSKGHAQLIAEEALAKWEEEK